MIRRPRRTIPATLVALAILAICVGTAVAVLQTLTGRRPFIPLATLASFGRGLRMDDTVLVTAGAVAAALGLILVVCALWPGRSDILPMLPDGLSRGDTVTHGDDAVMTVNDLGGRHGRPVRAAAGVSRAGLRTALRATAAETEGVETVRIRVRHRRVTVKARTELRDTAAVRSAIEEAVTRSLERAGLATTPKLRVAVKHTGERQLV